MFDLTELAALADEPALVAVEWTEDGVRSSDVLPCGGLTCEDLHLGPPPVGEVAACVPASRSAERGRSWAKAETRWISETEVLIGPDVKPARAAFAKDSLGFRLHDFRPGL